MSGTPWLKRALAGQDPSADAPLFPDPFRAPDPLQQPQNPAIAAGAELRQRIEQPSQPENPAVAIGADLRRQIDDEASRLSTFLKWRGANGTADPARQGEVLSLSFATGADPATVDANLETIRKQVAASRFNYDELVRRHPVLTDWLLDLHRAPLVQDDIANAGMLEWTLSAPLHQFGGAWHEQEMILRQNAELFGVGSEENRQRIRDLEQQYANRDYGARSFLAKAWLGLPKMAPAILLDLGSRVLGGFVGTALGGGAGAAAGAPAGGVGAAPGAAVGSAGGAFAGQFVGSAIFNGLEAAGPLYWQISQMQNADGSAIDPRLARALTAGGATLSGALMAGFGGRIAKSIPGVRDVLEKLGANTVRKELEQVTVGRAWRAFATRYGEHVATGGALMAANGAFSAATLAAARKATGHDAEIEEIVRTAARDFATGVNDMALFAGWAPFRDFLGDVGRAHAAEGNYARLHAAAQSYNQSKLPARGADHAERFVRDAAQGGPATHVYADLEAWDKHWEGRGIDPAEMAKAVMNDGGDAYAKAKENGAADLAIPVERFMKTLAKTESYPALKDDLTFDQEGLTKHRARRAVRETAQRLGTEAEIPADKLDPSARQVYDDYLQKGAAADGDTETAAASALAVANFHRRVAADINDRAERMGDPGRITAWELYTRQANVSITGPDGRRVYPAAPKPGESLAQPYREPTPEDRARWQSDPGAASRADQLATAEPLHVAERVPYPVPPEVRAGAIQFDRTTPLRFGDNSEVRVTMRGLRKYRAHSADPRTLSLLPVLPEVARRAQWMFDDPPATEQTQTVTYRHYAAPVELGGERLLATFTVREQRGGRHVERLLWDYQVGEHVQTQETAPQVPISDANRVAGEAPPAATKVRSWYRAVKGLESRRGAEKRGEITFTPAGDGQPVQVDIRLFQGKDPSTLAHETSHYLFRVMADIARRDDAPEPLRQDFAAALKWLEKDRFEDLTEADQERVAHAWEQFWFEGKPPAESVAGLFGRFRRWMMQIYGEISGLNDVYRAKYGRDIALSDEMRRVFQRWLVSDEEIRHAEAEVGNGIIPEFEDLFTPEEKAQDTQLAAAGQEAAVARLARQIAEGDRDADAQWIQNERDRIRAAVAADVDGQPAYRALAGLRAGKIGERELPRLPDGRILRLDRRTVAKRYGDRAAEEMPRGSMTPKGRRGADPDELAPMLGFADGGALVQALRGLPERDRVVGEAVDRQMFEAYGHPLTADHDALALAAQDAVTDDHTAKRILLRIRAFQRTLGPKSDFLAVRVGPEVMKDMAEDAIAGKNTSGFSAGYYFGAARRAGERATRAAAEGNRYQAAKELDSQLLNHFLGRAALDARSDLDKGERFLRDRRKTQARAQLGLADSAYRDAVDTVLEHLGFAAPPEVAEPRVGFEGLMQKLVDRQAAGVLPLYDDQNVQTGWTSTAFDTEAIRDLMAARTPWGDLTVEDARNVIDFVKAIRREARSKNAITVEGRKQDRTTVLGTMEETVRETLPARPAEEVDKRLRGAFSGLGAIVRDLDGKLLAMDTIVRMLDGGDSGIFHDVIWNRYLASRDREAELARTYLVDLTAQWEKFPKSMRRKAYETVDLGPELRLPENTLIKNDGPVTRSFLWMIALQMGNEGNKARLLGGLGWKEQDVMAALDRLMDRHEWEWVQSVWDSLESLYPELARVHEEVTGVRPGKVAATPVMTKHGVFRGGYFPAKYDRRVPGKGFQQEAAALEAVLRPAHKGAKTVQAHAQQRADYYVGMIDLDWSVVPSHVRQVLHDVAFRQYVRETGTLFLDRRFETMIKQRLGQERWLYFMPWLQAVAGAQPDAVPAHEQILTRAMGGIRSRVALQSIGYSLGVAAGDFSNPLVAAGAGLVKARHMTSALAKGLTMFPALRRSALEASPELRYRSDELVRNFQRELDRMGGRAGRENAVLRAVRETAYCLLETTDKLTSTVIWQGKFEQGMAEYGDHARAVREADAVVRQMQPSHDVGEQPAIIRDKRGLGGLMMFYGYMNKMFNVQRAITHEGYLAFKDADSPHERALAVGTAARVAGRLLGMYIGFNVAGEFLSGRGPEDDESWTDWLFRKVLLAPFSTVPFIGPALESVALGRKASIRQAPAISIAQQLFDTAGRGLKALQGGNVDGERLVWDALEAAGLIAGVPTRQPRKTLEYALGLAGGDSTAENPADVLSGLVYGQRQKQAANPFSTVSDAIGGE